MAGRNSEPRDRYERCCSSPRRRHTNPRRDGVAHKTVIAFRVCTVSHPCIDPCSIVSHVHTTPMDSAVPHTVRRSRLCTVVGDESPIQYSATLQLACGQARVARSHDSSGWMSHGGPVDSHVGPEVEVESARDSRCHWHPVWWARFRYAGAAVARRHEKTLLQVAALRRRRSQRVVCACPKYAIAWA